MIPVDRHGRSGRITSCDLRMLPPTLFPSPSRADKVRAMSLLTHPAARAVPQTGAVTGATTVLAQGKLYALQHPFALDGRVSSYPASARGFSVANSYLLTQ